VSPNGIVLQRVAACCSVLQYVVACCSVLLVVWHILSSTGSGLQCVVA